MLVLPWRKCRKLLMGCFLIPFLLFIVIVWIINSELNKIHPKHIIRENNQEEFVDKNGVKVIIGHYIETNLKNVPKATYDMINTNYFNPELNAGRNGTAVVIEPKDLLTMQQLFQINSFNLLASDKIPLNRSLPDFRRKKCINKYPDFKTYPTTSIIIVFHNEAWSTLLRTVWSVINRSPKELIAELILVDDASEREFLKKPLEDYIKNLPIKTRLLRSAERIGLIKARLKGAKAASGQVLTYLDAHCECTEGWLESLLAVIKEDRKTVACPVIDIIQDDTFAYVKGFELHWGAFNWNLQFRWYTLGGRELEERKRDVTKPFPTPTMAGGLFSIDKNYFFEIGSYDEDMSIWGGENLELSFRVWQCGGRIVIVPCSHVGHLFRKSSPYTFPGGIKKTLHANLARVALVWMDEWANLYFKFNNEARSVKDLQDVTSRIELRKRLQCKSFGWYLDNVWPANFFPRDGRFFGRIRNLDKNLCLLAPERKGLANQPMGFARLDICFQEEYREQMFVMTKEGFIMSDDSVCVDAPYEKIWQRVKITACSSYPRQKFVYVNKTKELRLLANMKCLDVRITRSLQLGLLLNHCDGSESQMWKLEPVEWKL